MSKHYIKRVLLLSIRLLILKGLQTGNLAGQGELLNTSSSSIIFFFISIMVAYTLSTGLSERTPHNNI